MRKTVFALGFFDGVHLGHQALLKSCVQMAGEQDLIPAALTFDAHPQSLFTDVPPVLLSSIPDREQLLHQYGIEEICVLPVAKNVMSTNWQSFLEFLLQKGAAGFVCGEDFRFGCRGEGTAEKLAAFCRERDLPWTIVPAQILDGVRISSTHIRRLIEDGDMETATRFLGHPHSLSSAVQHGKELGRTIGVPTANLTIPDGIIMPKFGVYATLVTVDGCSYCAVTNVGTRPTVGGSGVTVESWLLDYSGDLYGKHLTVNFYQFLRTEQNFPSLEDLQAQIRKDAEKVRKIFEKT